MPSVRQIPNVLLMRVWRSLVFLASLSPLLWWSFQVGINSAGPEPGRYLLLNLGQGALVLLLLTLSLTPLMKLTRWKGFVAIRRQLGLWSFSYAFLHLLGYLLFILGLDFSILLEDLVRRPYIIVGFIALLMLLALAATSNRYAMKRLGKRWKMLHRLAYPALLLILLHFFWVVRADMAQWSGYALAASLLLALRLPPVSRRLVRLGQRVRQK